MNIRLTGLIVALLSLPAPADPGAVGWRFDGTGQYPGANPPTEWSTTRNVAWATSMPDWSNASPTIAGDRLFVTSENTDLLCVNANDGRILWARPNDYTQVMTDEEKAQAAKEKPLADEARTQLGTVAVGLKELRATLNKLVAQSTQPAEEGALQTNRKVMEVTKGQIANLQEMEKGFKATLARNSTWELPPANEVNGYSSPTPVTDGQRVWAVFGNGVVACYGLDGQRQWVRRVDRSPIEDGVASSPLLVGGKLLVHINNLTALDPATGKTLWAAEKTEPTYGTPASFEFKGAAMVATANGDIVRLADGKVLARKISLVSYCSPMVVGDVAYFVQNISKGHGGGHVLRLAAGDGDALKAELLWQTKSAKDRYYATPVIDNGLIYAITQAKIFSVINAADGAVVKEMQLILGKGTTFPSPCLAGGKLFVSHDSGQTAVLTPGREPKLLATNILEPFRCTPLFVGDRIYIRGLKTLYCIKAAP